MQDILLINPNASEHTTAMMVNIAAAKAPPGMRVTGITAGRGPAMIVNDDELAAAALDVESAWRAVQPASSAGIIISAFGDPGLEQLRAASTAHVTGLCEASMLQASRGGRRFGVATVTPDLASAIAARANELGLSPLYTGIRLTDDDPRLLAADPKSLEEALALAVARCIEDGAQAVIIGGGPLGQAAISLAGRFDVPVIAPISAAMKQLSDRLRPGTASRAG